MKTVEITLYKFKELPPHGQEQAINRYAYINRSGHIWQDFTCADAENIGLKITSFDEHSCEAEFIEGAEYTANKILEDHGEQCETYKTAVGYLSERDQLAASLSDGEDVTCVAEGNEDEFDEACDALDAKFLYSLRKDYRALLQQSYEYYTGKDGIRDALIDDDYDFTEDGRIY